MGSVAFDETLTVNSIGWPETVSELPETAIESGEEPKVMP